MEQLGTYIHTYMNHELAGSLVLYMYGQWCSAQHGQFVVLHRVASTAHKILYYGIRREESSSHHVMHCPWYMYVRIALQFTYVRICNMNVVNVPTSHSF